jgi:hypothetical protein
LQSIVLSANNVLLATTRSEPPPSSKKSKLVSLRYIRTRSGASWWASIEFIRKRASLDVANEMSGRVVTAAKSSDPIFCW